MVYNATPCKYYSYTYFINRVSQSEIEQMFFEANHISIEFIKDSILTQLIVILCVNILIMFHMNDW
jgi:hypothetical protein